MNKLLFTGGSSQNKLKLLIRLLGTPLMKYFVTSYLKYKILA